MENVKMNYTNLILAVALILCASGALAEDKTETKNNDTLTPFLGIKSGYQFSQDKALDGDEPKGALWGIYGGLQLSKPWSWDLGYQQHNNLYAKTTNVNVKTWLIESALKYDFYVTQDLSFYGRLGAAYWNMEKSQSISKKIKATGYSPIGELGINYALTPSMKASAAYQYIDKIGNTNTGNYDSHALLLTLSYVFGQSTSSPENATRSPIETTTVALKPLKSQPPKEPKEPPQLKETLSPQYSIGQDYIFDINSTEIGEKLTEKLKDIASLLTQYPQAKVQIVGHSDATGPKKYNQRLSEQRAQVVANKLVEYGANLQQINFSGQGEYMPIASNTTTEKRAKNRRVEITVLAFKYQEKEVQ